MYFDQKCEDWKILPSGTLLEMFMYITKWDQEMQREMHFF
jgi:hypothetical protein